MITKVSKNIQRAELFTCRLIEIIHGAVFVTLTHAKFKLMYPGCTKSRIKTKKLANRKKKYTKMLQDSKPHLLSAKFKTIH